MSSPIAVFKNIEQPESQRRAGRRFPVQLSMEYRLIQRGHVIASGHGTTLNISSSGILISTYDPLPVSVEIELFVAWPAKLGEQIPLTLHVKGRTLRSEGTSTAIAMSRHEFRTRRQTMDHAAELHMTAR